MTRENGGLVGWLRRNGLMLVVVVGALGYVVGSREFKSPKPPPAIDTDAPSVAAVVGEGAALTPPLGEASERPRLVEFYTQDCPACRMMQPAIDKLQADCAGGAVEVVQIDVGEAANSALAGRYQLRAVPTVSLFDATGAEIGRLEGAVSLRALRRAAAQLAETPCGGEDGAAGLDDIDEWAPACDEACG